MGLSGCAAPIATPAEGDTHQGVLQLVIGRHSRHLYLEGKSGKRTLLSFPEGHPAEVMDASGRVAPIRRGGIEVEVRGPLAENGSLLAEAISLANAGESIESVTSALTTLVKKERRVAVLMIGYDDQPFPYSVAEVKRVAFGSKNSLSKMFDEVSYSQASLIGDVLGPFVAHGFSTKQCTGENDDDGERITDEASAEIRSQMPELADYDHVVNYMPGCLGDGSGDGPGKQTWIGVPPEDFVLFTGHELGHNLGLDHAATLTCKSDGQLVPVGGTCTADEYGDIEPMGDGVTHFHARHKSIVGWLSAEQTVLVKESGTYTLTPIETASGLKALRVVGGNGRTYEIELRKPIGLDKKLPEALTDALLIRSVPDASTDSVGSSFWINPTLSESNQKRNFDKASLREGKTFRDPFGTFSVKLNSIDGNNAEVKVTLKTPPVAHEGEITFERWPVSDRSLAGIPLTSTPAMTGRLSAFETYANWGGNYGVRVQGLVTAPETGAYVFWISSRGSSELSLGTDESAAGVSTVAWVDGGVDYRKWNNQSSQKSAPVQLIAGQRYRLSALANQRGSDDFLAVGWSKPGDTTAKAKEIIPGKYLSPIED